MVFSKKNFSKTNFTKINFIKKEITEKFLISYEYCLKYYVKTKI